MSSEILYSLRSQSRLAINACSVFTMPEDAGCAESSYLRLAHGEAQSIAMCYFEENQ